MNGMEKENDVWREAWRSPENAPPVEMPLSETEENIKARMEPTDTGQAVPFSEDTALMDNSSPATDKTDGSGQKRFLYPLAHVKPYPPPKVNTGDEHILLVQLILCTLFFAFVWFARSAEVSFLPELRAEFDSMMTTGVTFSTENVFARFADAVVEELRLKMRGLLERLEEPQALSQGEGGYWPVGGTNAVPEGATLDSYTLPIELSAPLSGNVTSGYGFRVNPVNAEDDFHAGIDIAADEGTPVLAAQNGIVVRTGHTRLRGYYVIVRHACGVQTLYQHLSLILVRGGETVEQGQTIAATGSTGFVTGPHLHLELILDGVRVDPSPSFPGLCG